MGTPIKKNPYDIGMGAIGQPSAAPANTPGLIAKGAPQAAANSWLPTEGLTQGDWFKLYNSTTNFGQAPKQGSIPLRGGGGGGGGRGGGGGGGAAAPTLNQGQLDWYASMLQNSKPYDNQFNPLTMPQWQNVDITPFDTGQYDQLRGALGQAVESDRAAATGAYDSLQNYLQSNYSNPYSNATYATSQNVPGQTQLAMQRMLSAQGQNPQMGSETYRQGQSADSAFGNLLAVLGSNEDVAQRNRLSAVQADRGTTQRALDMAQLQGQTAIGQQQAQAKSQWQQRADERALLNAQTRYQGDTQGALANWQRQNEVGDTNNAAKTAYYSSVMSALTNLLPLLVQQGGSLNLPDYAAFGLT